YYKNLFSPVTDVEDNNSKNIPDEFVLYQNYPNPFNPSTTISFTIPSVTLSGVEGSRVQLKVFDILGNEIVTLINEYKPAGSYQVRFDAKGLSSGVYFYTLNVNGVTYSKSMMLLK
ncbi:MAG TPA: T9SS type A sorting domain-containing protein, partial [Ignavibacteriaceae bacterium]|nr:T9SS type A sorting domain-containing protein [Ignavibacteriaceae bacterium]